ncbi:sugar ABC transporter permease [Alkalihalophilus pseudofirmus]|uniref:carbohydrate ABC transporter permease n=1 Tax=Alkalihalophilus pseudofirmus TaxID=79885 RepID=UPI00259B9297|nr:sugar ABC transporter permease [Alkalihalophilus pseudofirmus]WEG18862.1 sugar ABC transporter permease [Alkalihalophilus pseudofirmus]
MKTAVDTDVIMISPEQKKNKRKKGKTILLFVLPALLVYSIFILYPIIATFNYSMYNWNGVQAQKTFIGLENYFTLFSDSTFWQALQNNMLLVLVSVFVQIPLGLIMALVLFSPIMGKKFLNVIFFLPYLMSTVAIGLLWIFMYDPINGPVNQIVQLFGFNAIPWLADKNTAMIAILIVVIWQFSPFYMILFKAAMVGIPDELYEAASIDGANELQKFFYVTLPALIPTFVTSSILAIVGSLKAFDIFYIMTGGGPGGATEILGTYMYKQGFINFSMGYASTIAAVMFLIAFACVIIIQVIEYQRKKRGLFS